MPPLSAPAYLAAAARTLPVLPPERLAELAPLLVLAPHPDDESLACGGLIAALAAAGRPVRVAAVSDGAASHPGSRRFPPARLRGRREAELLLAARELGLAAGAVAFLRLPDSRVPRRGEPGFAAALDRLVAAAVRGPVPRTLAVSWRHDPHADHAAACELAFALRERLEPRPRVIEYVVWGWTLSAAATVAEPLDGFRLDVASRLPAKRRAIARHRTQRGKVVRDAPNGFALTPGMIARFLGPHELFLELPAP